MLNAGAVTPTLELMLQRLVQGYLLGRPVPPDALREQLRQPAGAPGT